MVYNHIARNVGATVQKRIDTLKIGQKMQDLPEELWHKSFRYYVKEDKTRRGGPNMRLIRLDPDKPSLTVTGFVFNKFVHPYENRFITVREAARLQGFPDDIELKGTLTSTQQQIGNAVPVPLGEAVFSQICKFASNCGTRSLNAFSLFSGAGGLDLAARNVNVDGTTISTKVAIDCWDDACNTLRGYLGSQTYVETIDIASISNPLEYWFQHTGLHEKPDLVYGGPPCQAFSQAGRQKALNDPRGTLIFEYLRFIDDLHPRFFVMENVSNLKAVMKGQLFSSIVDKMQQLGYNISEGVLCAADYGAPQLRKRAIIIGTDKDLGQVQLPASTHAADISLLCDKKYTTVGEAFAGLPMLNASTENKSAV